MPEEVPIRKGRQYSLASNDDKFGMTVILCEHVTDGKVMCRVVGKHGRYKNQQPVLVLIEELRNYEEEFAKNEARRQKLNRRKRKKETGGIEKFLFENFG